MGRAKLVIKFIEDRKARNAIFSKRKEGLKKKAYEFSTLCGVDTCLICYKEDSNKPITWPENRAEVDRIIRRYLMVSAEERRKREMGLCLSDEKKKKRRMQDNLATRRQENTNMPMFPTWDDRLDNWPVASLRQLVSNLNEKIGMVKKRIKLLTSSNSNPCLEQSNQQVEVSSCNFPLHQPYPLSCVKTEEQHSSGKDFLQSPASLETNSVFNPSPHFEQFSDTDNFSSISTLPLLNQESSLSALPLFNHERSVSALPLFNQESGVSTLPLFNKESRASALPMFNHESSVSALPRFNQESSVFAFPLFNQESSTSMLPLFNQEVGVMSIMSSRMPIQSNEYDSYSASIFHQQQCFQGNRYFGLPDFLPMNPQSFQTILPHSQTHHLDLGCLNFKTSR